MNPILKWAGGKEKELPYILERIPERINRFIEPFAGGGAVYFNINIKDSFINDKSEELIRLYNCVKEGNLAFFQKAEAIYYNFQLLGDISQRHEEELLKIYNDYCIDMENEEKNIKIKFKDSVYNFVFRYADEFNGILSNDFNIELDNFLLEIRKNLESKIQRMHKIERVKVKLCKSDVLANIECALKSGFYMHFRYLYNESIRLDIPVEFQTAIFYFIREYCYASMFRYNKAGKFNVPYGGISYNRKEFDKKIKYLKSEKLYKYLSNTEIFCDDFEVFFNKVNPGKSDFIFLDPPYDTEFSTYARNEFTREDQLRLCHYLKKTKANFMLIIKNTDFIYNIYNEKNFNISSFNKKYIVSFQNRNDKNAQHLIIKNYS